MEVSTLISKITTAPKNGGLDDIDHELLKLLKTKCKDNNQTLEEAFYYLSVDLKRKNGVNRLKALQVIDVLFQRSKWFRGVVADNIKLIAQSGGLLVSLSSTDAQSSNTVAASHTTEVENLVKQLLESWDIDYGDKYPQIHAVMRYCKETLGTKMPNVQVR